jgi:hypothetical protein
MEKKKKEIKFENRKQRVLPLTNFLFRLARYGVFAIVLIVFSVGIGTLGYKHFGNLNWIDSFYMACMILTGMGPVSEMTTNSSKLFSSFYALYSGIAFLSITAVFFAPIIHRLLHILQVEKSESE